MAKDLKIDFTTGKLLNETVNGKDRVLQQIKLALRIIKGEWELDSSFGVGIFSEEGADAKAQDVRNMLSQTDGVISVKTVEVTPIFNSNGYGNLLIDAIIQIDTDIIRISERLG